MKEIKPIETEYKGYRFRSRLEARWAVFFDEAGFAYDYELEGYELEDGTKYLPDFYLPEFCIFIEIKPFAPGFNKEREQWESKCASFRSSVGKAIFIAFGDPAEDVWGTFFGWSCNDGGGGEFQDYARFTDVGEWGKPLVVLQTFGNNGEIIGIDPAITPNKRVINQSMMIDYYWQHAAHLLSSAMTEQFNPEAALPGTIDWMKKKARQARFEHGEKPNGKHPTIDELRKTEPAIYALGELITNTSEGSLREALTDWMQNKCKEKDWDMKALMETFGKEMVEVHD